MKKTLAFLAGIILSVSILGANQKTFIIGVENIQYYPQYSNENGEYNGYARELLDTFAKDKGYTFTYEPLPVKRLFGLFLKGAYDFKYPDNPHWSAKDKEGKNVVYSSPVVDYIDGVMVKPENKGKGKESIKTLGLVMGFTAFEYLGDIEAKKMKTAENKNFTALLKQADLGRIDGAYANVAVAQHQLREVLKKPNALVFDPSLPHSKDSYRLSTIAHPTVIEEFNAWMESNKPNVQAIKDKFKVEAGVN